MTNKNVRLLLGLLTGLVGLLAMVRLVAGAFSGSRSTFAWIFVALAMIPWVAYAGWRARHGHLSTSWGLVVFGLGVLGLVLTWLFTIGAVLALACSLASFAVIWLHDWPPRRPAGDARMVHMEELTDEAVES
ncbi:hypothetical protein GCM10009841_29270 [Microlunatus panaciterrae]|uniref:DUF4233 domain-containing protein n=1 Tax=Microlunatus panaciterrae TaxID=400768 RepID=A0ABS2RGC9_9ACTN|nr:hypothetical protein [Microlunatus panaciterrae]MBM7797587.1 hypothetical protein [Microlunatus panaciterrae]